MSKLARAAAHQNMASSTRRVGRTVLLVVLALLLAGGTAVATVYTNLQGNISQTNVDDLLGTARPKTTQPTDRDAGKPLNIILLGSDVRSGASDIDGSGAAGAVTGMRADTSMLVHISADRSRIEVVSIPRDTLVDIPACTVWRNEEGTDSYESRPQKDAMFNSAFSVGGNAGQIPSAAACAMKTVENMTGIRLDGFIVVDFNSFQEIVQALGGVPMYFEDDMYDKYAGLNISAGCRLLDGNQALALARARKQLGDGSDISRIGRQQELVTAMLQEVLNLNLLTNMPSLYKVLDAATASISTSKGLGDIPTLVGLASSLRSIDMENVQFITMPWAPAGNRVTVSADAQVLWDALANDRPVSVTTNKYGHVTIVDLGLNPQPATEAPATDAPATGAPATGAPATEAPATTEPATTPTTPVCTKENAQP